MRSYKLSIFGRFNKSNFDYLCSQVSGLVFSETFLKYSSLLALLLLWELIARSGYGSEFLPSFTASLESIKEMWLKSHLFMHIMVSLCRVFIGLAVATFIAVPSGYILGNLLPALEKRLDPLLRIFGLINPYCLFPLFVVFFGVGEMPKISVLAWVCFWPIFFHTMTGVRTIEPILLKTAKSMNSSPFDIFFKITLPGAAPSIFSGLRLGVEISFFILIAAEMTGATAGLGWIVHNAGANYQVTRIYGAGICIVTLGVLINRFLLSLQKGLFFWQSSPLVGDLETKNKKRISRIKALVMVAMILILLIVGLYQIMEAERLLNDPDSIPEYRVYDSW